MSAAPSSKAAKSQRPANTTARARWRDFDDDDVVDDITAASLTGMSKFTLRAWRSGDDPRGPRFVRLGGRCLYRISALRAWIVRNEVATADDPISDPHGPNIAALRRIG